MTEIIRIARSGVPTRLARLGRWSIPETVRREIVRFVEELGLGKVNAGRRISERRQAKYLDALKVFLPFFNKPTDRLTLKDIERFEKALATDQIRSRIKGTPFALSTKADLRKSIKVFLRWRLGTERAIKLAGWLDTRDPKKTPDYLKETQVDALHRQCRTAVQRYIVAVLFDSGARAEEFLNIRFEDVHLPEGRDNFVRLTLKEEYSKTKGRTISLYWRHSLEAVRTYVHQRLAEGIRPTDPVFAGTYDGMRMFLARLGRSVLQRHVHPHLLRHSSATYYASRINRQQLCYRYGWRFSSDMPDVYISRSGMENQELDEKFTQTELSTLKDDLVKVTQENQMKGHRIEELQRSMDEMKRNMDMVTEILAANPSIREVEAAIQRKRQAAAGKG